jgi:hypothetical protein
MKSLKPIYEFLLWDACNNNCKFCFERQNPQRLTLAEREYSIDKLMQVIDSDTFIKGSHLLLMGGEIFDTPTVFDKLKPLIDKVIGMMKVGDIDILYLNTNLIYKKIDILVYLLERLKENDYFSRFQMTTSYDLEGRFTPKTEQLMLHNLEYVRNKYPNCNIAVNTILSNTVCNKILSREWDVKEFAEKYKVNLMLIPYIVLLPSLSASRSKIFKTLKFVDDEIPNYIHSMLLNLDNHQEKRIYRFNPSTKEYEYSSCANSDCGHSINYKTYSTKGTCFVCDLKNTFEGF